MNRPLQNYIIVSTLAFGTHCRIELMLFYHDSCTYDARCQSVAILTSAGLKLLSPWLVLHPRVGGCVSPDSLLKPSEFGRLSVTSTTTFGILLKHLVYGRYARLRH